ncbi:uncharacterized protein LOC129989424 isoform X2 [Argiope bruennichi]|uniref:Uncharacterized protein n=2 Tax=Argiope bruennichi TaxID=94029 RepID=A0A8T0EIZ6_ARGBR|nr:uncharacterized protein LOC129989424 isoform X2 [Argiope bruennichi]XP_055953937.1 uncharacterized protein LOC129989424 isoform X2 [Argiope bruennichi]XP_055953938.1 uncharacterized protein LOC129989424 isoform X2 [Argiope bruennichi]XP_055953939.1 uncharacterized protein LOC129989424 isoform X2 [Argiope bruennichi]KAF8771308.1 hypothetical protein HNY73_018746 [Argiope bruennichi]
MTDKTFLFNKCCNPPKWKSYGIAIEETVTYSKLLGQKREFHQFIEFNDKISNSGNMDSYCIVDKRYSPSKGSNIDIFVFNDDEHYDALYLGYSVHKDYAIENCNDLITFLNFNKNCTFHLHNSFIYVKSADRFKWVLFFGMLEFLVKNLNMSVIGSQFYFPLFSKFLIMNELQLMISLQSWFKSLNTNFQKTLSQTNEVSAIRFKKSLPTRASYSLSALQNLKNKISFCSEQTVEKMNLSMYTCKSSQKVQLKRKSVDSCAGEDSLSNTKKFKSQNACHCKNNTWKIFTSFEKTSILNYTSILEARKLMDSSEAMHIFPTDCMHNSNSSRLHQNRNRLNQEIFPELDKSDIFSQTQLLYNVIELKNTTNLNLQETNENPPKYEHISDVHAFKEMKSDNKEHFALGDIGNLQLSVLECEEKECKNEGTCSEAINTGKSKNITSPSVENLHKAGSIGIKGHSVSFQTVSGKSLKISEAALQAAEKMFEDISSENLDIVPQKKTQNVLQLKSTVNDKCCVGFQTASGKSLHASKLALEAAEKLFKEITVEEEIDVFPEKQTQTKQNNKEYYPSLKECVDEDISKVLAENFFEDIAFDDKEMDSKLTDDSVTLNLQKSENVQTHKRKKSLGGRRTLKPYVLKK